MEFIALMIVFIVFTSITEGEAATLLKFIGWGSLSFYVFYLLWS
jgi:hypothetical protein